MELKGIKEGDIVVCNERHSDKLLWGSRCEPLVGKPMKVLDFDSRGYIHCRGVEQDDCAVSTVWRVEWLEPYKKFKVGDIVICKKRHESADSVRWVAKMDDTVGKPMKIVGISPSGNLHCKIDGETTWAYLAEWIEHYTEKGNGEMKKDGNNLSPIVVDENAYYGIREIISNPAKRATTVHFNDGKIICVKAGVDVERPDIYSAVTAAIGIHFAGSNNALKNIISRKTTELKPKRKGPRKEFTIEVGDLVKLTRRGQKDALYSARLVDGKDHPLLSVRIEKNVDREMLVTEVVEENGKTIAYVNTPEKLKEFEYKIPVEFLRITRKGE